MTASPPAAPSRRAAEGMTLALNAAENVLQIAIADEYGRFLYSQQIYAASRGVEILMPALSSALVLLGKKPDDFSRVAAVCGPGGFTGIRLGIVAAAGIARAAGAKQAGLDYMRLLARECLPSLNAADADALLWVLVRARRELVYAQAFSRDWNNPARFRELTNLEVLNVAGDAAAARRMLDLAARYGASRILLAGSGLEANRDSLVGGLAVPGAPRVTGIAVCGPRPETLAAAAVEAEYGDKDIPPQYVRISDAEENLPRIAEKLGLDPEEAAKRLAELTTSSPPAAECGRKMEGA